MCLNWVFHVLDHQRIHVGKCTFNKQATLSYLNLGQTLFCKKLCFALLYHSASLVLGWLESKAIVEESKICMHCGCYPLGFYFQFVNTVPKSPLYFNSKDLAEDYNNTLFNNSAVSFSMGNKMSFVSFLTQNSVKSDTLHLTLTLTDTKQTELKFNKSKHVPLSKTKIFFKT